MYHDVSPVFYRADEVRSPKRIIDNQRYAVTVCHSGYALYVEHLAVGVAERLGIHSLGLRSDGSLERIKVVDIHDGIADTLRSQRVGNQIIRAAVEIIGCDHMVSRSEDVLQSISGSSST